MRAGRRGRPVESWLRRPQWSVVGGQPVAAVTARAARAEAGSPSAGTAGDVGPRGSVEGERCAARRPPTPDRLLQHQVVEVGVPAVGAPDSHAATGAGPAS